MQEVIEILFLQLENCFHEYDACHFGRMPETSRTEKHKLSEFERKIQGYNSEDSHSLHLTQTNLPLPRALCSGSPFWLLKNAFSASRTYCSHNPRWCASQETTWWPALGAQISQVSSTGHSLLLGIKRAEGRRGWGLVSTPAICWIASTPAICCIAKPVVF